MTQFKDKSKGNESAPTGIFTYPVLMAADILLYDTDVVPVGTDQKQHIELTRDLAMRFNNKFGDTFVIPEHKVREVGAKIMSLDDPTKKMSKSAENPLSKICLLDPPSRVKKSIMKATTDSEGQIRFDPENKAGVSNLLTIYNSFTEMPIPEIEKKYEGAGYGTFKKDLVEIINGSLEDIQMKYKEIRESEELEKILKEGTEKAQDIANETLNRVKKNMGFVIL
jgi:tryptophanyl-tRNA synthetase